MGAGLVQTGHTFPDFTLSDLNGASRSTADARSKGLLLVAFFKVNCPTCQLTFPYLQKLADACPTLTVWGVSQNDAMETRAFERDYGTSFPMLLDKGLEVTDRFDLQSVPAMYLTDESGVVLEYMGAWSKDFVNGIARRVAERTGTAPEVPVTDADRVPVFTPG
ncbi:MAG: TlpA family protein disulfide reductase [Fimbriimonadia bacterium]|jgi:peroxiredoxin